VENEQNPIENILKHVYTIAIKLTAENAIKTSTPVGDKVSDINY
jgi:hypothetical protein